MKVSEARKAELEAKVREIPLTERLKQAQEMIGKMCSELRCPKMSIPVRWNDEDFFISTTIKDALEILENA